MTDDEFEQAGIGAAKAGRLDEAQRLLAKAVGRHPESAEAWWWRSQPARPWCAKTTPPNSASRANAEIPYRIKLFT